MNTTIETLQKPNQNWFVQPRKYRNDIDGLRAIAVLAVILFHFGCLPNGFLGVDVFFVISGFLITGIISREIKENRFSITNFYLKRIRRIIPLSLFICLLAVILGIATMLPDDLENLAQSAIATNLFSNNILQAITTKNYWDVVNEYKPLMHTWSLAIEEQYYLFYPLLFLLVRKTARRLNILIVAAFISLFLCFLPFAEFQKFFLIPFRFWELAIGGIAAIILNNQLINNKYSPLLILSLISLLCFKIPFIASQITLIITVLITLGILISKNKNSNLSSFILENKIFIFIGKISFSLYMWHQLILAYARYALYQELHTANLIFISIITLILSVLTYQLIEQPFRNKKKINTRNMLLTLGIVFFITLGISSYIHLNAGVLKDIPELDIKKDLVERNMHAQYNSKIYSYDRDFVTNNKIKTLVIGNSFARDWTNVLLESKYGKNLEISYIYDPYEHEQLKDRVKEADIIFYSTPTLQNIRELNIPKTKVWAIGTKNFGSSNGIFYNYKGDNYFNQRTLMVKGVFKSNQQLRQEWGEKYIDYIAKIIDQDNTVPIFTPSHKFISQDCRHLTKAGAKYFAQIFDNKLISIFSKINQQQNIKPNLL